MKPTVTASQLWMQLCVAKVIRADLAYQDAQAIYCADRTFSAGPLHVDILRAPATDLPFTLYALHLSKGFHSHGLLHVWMTPNCSLILVSFLSYKFSLSVYQIFPFLSLTIRYFHSLSTPQHKPQLKSSSSPLNTVPSQVLPVLVNSPTQLPNSETQVYLISNLTHLQ